MGVVGAIGIEPMLFAMLAPLDFFKMRAVGIGPTTFPM